MKNKASKKQKSRTSVFVTGFMALFCIAIGCVFYVQADSLDALKAERAKLESQIADEKKKKAELESEIAYYDSDEYIEQIARDELGYVKPNELLIINKAEK